jgi:hypothetical protein
MSSRCSRPRRCSIDAHVPIAVTSHAARSSRRSCSAGCGSTSCAGCAGETSTSREARFAWGGEDRRGARQVDILPALRDELSAWKARAPRAKSSGYVFATAGGGRPSKDNVRSRVVHAAIAEANEAL